VIAISDLLLISVNYIVIRKVEALQEIQEISRCWSTVFSLVRMAWQHTDARWYFCLSVCLSAGYLTKLSCRL